MPRTKRKSEDVANVVTIKRYGNRRLYNLETGSYVSFEEIRDLIRAGRDVVVVDSRTKEDITRLVLTQIIFEEEKNKRNLLPLPFLYQLIRHRDDSLQDFFQNYLAASFEAYLKTRQEFDRQFRSWLEMTPVAPRMWEQFFQSGGKKKTEGE